MANICLCTQQAANNTSIPICTFWDTGADGEIMLYIFTKHGSMHHIGLYWFISLAFTVLLFLNFADCVQMAMEIGQLKAVPGKTL